MNKAHPSSPNQNREQLRLAVMRSIEANPEMSQRDIARELGVSLGGVNYAISALVERRFVKARNFGRCDNMLGVHTLPHAGMKKKSELAASFLSRELEECEVLRQEIEALRLELGDSGGAGS